MFARDVKKEGIHIGKQEYILASPLKPMGMDGVALCMLLSPLLAVSVFIPQGMTLVPIALLLLVGYVGPVSAVTCTAILVTLSTVFFGFWGAALSTVLLVPILVVSSYMVEHEQSFWQSAAGSGVTMFASIGLAMLLVSALAGADVVTALSNMMRQAFSVSQTFSDMVLTMMMQLGAITSASGGAVDIATLDAAARGQLIEQLVLILDTLMRLEIPMQMATGSVAAGVLGQAALRKGVLSRGDKVDYPPLRTWTVPKGWGRVLGATLAALYVLLTLYDLLRSGMWAALFTLPQLLAVWLVYLVFFWDRIGDLLREFGFAVRHQNSHQTIQFKSAVKQQRKKAQQQGYRHKCEVCGRTDTDFPDLQFRYCSKCAGYHCFCEDHIFNHTHFTQ